VSDNSAETDAASLDIEGEVRAQATAPNGEQSVFATDDVLVSADRSGQVQWRHAFGPRGESVGVARPSCRYSGDGSVVWLYRPDVYSGRGEADRWIALDAATGAVLGDAVLKVPGGHGAMHFPHPDGTHMLLDVGCGQDGSYGFLGRIDQDRMACSPWPDAAASTFGNLVIAALAADGRRVLAVDHDATEVALLDFPSGIVSWRFALADFGFDLEADQLETAFLWDARFLDDRYVLVEFKGETSESGEDEPEWTAAGLGDFEDYTAYQVIDLEERRILGPADAAGDHNGHRPRFLPSAH
jgi:hypothetical protein